MLNSIVSEDTSGGFNMMRLRTLFYLWLLMIICMSSLARAASIEAVRRSVFKISVISQPAQFNQPWLFYSPRSSSGTGFYIGQNRIITNAHVVSNATFITVTQDGSDRSLEAEVKFIAHDCDLAILQVKAGEALKNLTPLELGGMPRLRRPVSTIGYPTGGDQLSITDGIVSRVGFRRYVHSNADNHLLVQVDSAINPGNSGGPVVQAGKVVGVAFQTQTNAENTGYIIPTPVIRRFLKDVEDNVYDGHPLDGFEVEENIMENAGARAYYGLPRDKSGVLVTYVYEYGPSYGKLLPGDVLVSVDGQPIGIDGSIIFHDERVSFRVIFDLRQMGDVVEYGVLRKGKMMTVKVTAAPARPHYSQAKVYSVRPRFYVYAGMVFTALSQNYLLNWGREWYFRAPLLLRFIHSNQAFLTRFSEARDIILLIAKLDAPVNSYVEMDDDLVVDMVDSKQITSLDQLKTILENPRNPFQVIDFWQKDTPLIIDAKSAKDQDKTIKQRYRIEPTEWLHDERKL